MRYCENSSTAIRVGWTEDFISLECCNDAGVPARRFVVPESFDAAVDLTRSLVTGKFIPLAMFCIRAVIITGVYSVFVASETAPFSDYSRDQLQPLTKFRQHYRRTIDGRLCAAAFVQDRKAYTGCTEAPDPSGESGRQWCYVEPQVSLILAHRQPACSCVTVIDG